VFTPGKSPVKVRPAILPWVDAFVVTLKVNYLAYAETATPKYVGVVVFCVINRYSTDSPTPKRTDRRSTTTTLNRCPYYLVTKVTEVTK
jgi:hypothetical protein